MAELESPRIEYPDVFGNISDSWIPTEEKNDDIDVGSAPPPYTPNHESSKKSGTVRRKKLLPRIIVPLRSSSRINVDVSYESGTRNVEEDSEHPVPCAPPVSYKPTPTTQSFPESPSYNVIESKTRHIDPLVLQIKLEAYLFSTIVDGMPALTIGKIEVNVEGNDHTTDVDMLITPPATPLHFSSDGDHSQHSFQPTGPRS